MTSLTKIHNPQPKNFFGLQTRRLVDLFEPLNSSLAHLVEELRRWQGNQKLLVLGQNLGTIYLYTGSQSVKVKVVP